MDACLARRKTAARAGVSWQGAPGNRIFMKENKINRRNNMEFLWEGVMAITPQQFVMYLIGGLLIWLAVKKEYEPALLLPMGFGAIMVNLPLSGVINQVTEASGRHRVLYSGCLRRRSARRRRFRFCSLSESGQ